MRREVPPNVGHRFWPEEALEAIHSASLEVLVRADVRVEHAELRRPGVAFVGERREWAESGHTSVVDAASERAAELIARGPLGLGDQLAAALGDAIGAAAKEAGVSGLPRLDTLLATDAGIHS